MILLAALNALRSLALVLPSVVYDTVLAGLANPIHHRRTEVER